MKKLVIAGVAATIGLAGVGTAAYATTTSANNSNNQSTTRAEKTQLTEEQKAKMKAAREAKQTELKNWLKEQGIDESYIKYLSGRGGKGGEKRQGVKPADSTTQATNNS